MTTLNVQGHSNLNDVSANNLYLTGNLVNNNILNNYRILSITEDNLSSGAVLLICVSDGDNECVGKFYYQRSTGHDGSGLVDIVVSSRNSSGAIPHGFCSYQTDQETSNTSTPHRFSLITGIFSGITYVGLKYEGGDAYPFSEAFFNGLWKSTGTNTPFEIKLSSSVTSQTPLPIGNSELSLQNKRLVINNGNVGINQTNPSYTLDVGGTLGVTGNTTVGGTLGVTGNTTVGGVNIQDKDVFFHGSTLGLITLGTNSTIEWNQNVYGSNINSNGFIPDRSGYYSITLNLFFGAGSTGSVRIGVKVNGSVFRSAQTYIISSDSANRDVNMFTGNMIVFLSVGQRLTTYVASGTVRYYGQHSYVSGFYIGSS